MTPRVLSALTLLVLCGGLVSCAHFAPDRDLADAARVPESYALYVEEEVEAPAVWWGHFHAPELDGLVRQALSGNFSLQEAVARLEQARAQATGARAGLYPDLSLTGSASYTRWAEAPQTPLPVAAGGTGASGASDTAESYGLGLASSYELDLWGRIRSQAQAAGLGAEASREDLNTAATAVSAQVADTWVQLVAERQQLLLLRAQQKTNQTLLELLELRFRNALSNAIDVYQQEQALLEVESAMPLSQSRVEVLQHQLAVLLGRPPRADLGIAADVFPLPEDLPPTGLPADLLVRRPDIRAAGLRLRAADQQVAAARADRLPAVRLRASAGYEAAEFNELFDNWILNLAGNLAAPLFDGGRRRAEVDRSEAVARERLAAYRRVVYEAVREVEDALVQEQKQRDHVRGLERQLAVAKQALGEAQNRYRNGLSDYLPVITQVLTVQRQERNLIDQRRNQYRLRVALCRALGGVWSDPEQVAGAEVGAKASVLTALVER